MDQFAQGQGREGMSHVINLSFKTYSFFTFPKDHFFQFFIFIFWFANICAYTSFFKNSYRLRKREIVAVQTQSLETKYILLLLKSLVSNRYHIFAQFVLITSIKLSTKYFQLLPAASYVYVWYHKYL